jgi:carbamoyl-phosphate synthase large subunit
MPKRNDINTIMILGAGPIVIGQGCEFDYSGVQACKALRSEGYRVVLVNSNPATIMTDPDLADATYVEPLTDGLVERVIEKEKPDALLSTVGGQTALNLAVELSERGVLEKHGVELLGANLQSIRLAEDRSRFKEAMLAAGLPVPPSEFANTVDEALAVAELVGYPALCRASRTLGGAGGGVAHDAAVLEHIASHGLRLSPVDEVLIERSLLGWKEYELEVMVDGADNFVVVCSIENVDPMGVHTGDSITVAPAQTLTDKELQNLRDLSRRVMETVGVKTGGSNVQFAINPKTGETLIIEMNPRVSRSSALASKATGFPIAKLAALIAVGYTLDEIANDITRETPASFEPSLDYTVVKIPRWNFEKFPGVDSRLGPQMKSVGEVMAIGRTFPETLNKAIRGLEIGLDGFSHSLADKYAPEAVLAVMPTADRLFHLAALLGSDRAAGREAATEAGYDPWYTSQLERLLDAEDELIAAGNLSSELLRRVKRLGFSDASIARACGLNALEVRRLRIDAGVVPSYYRVDTCAAEFRAHTPYLYSTYERDCEAEPTNRDKVMILGGGPNRIGQGIEFDYCCVQACWALEEMGYETIMVNCNPETVSTDYDTADRLYFESLTYEDVLNIVEVENPVGVIVQLGGQTPINLTESLAAAGVPVWGTAPDSVALAEDRGRFGELLCELEIDHPAWGLAESQDEALTIAHKIGYPVLVRPSFVLGGRAMAIAYNDTQLEHFLIEATRVAGGGPILVDQFIEDAFELDVDALSDGERVVIAGVMQHIEEAGVHSGDSACVLPPYKISNYHLSIVHEYTERLGRALGVRGLMNIQFAIKDDVVFVIEVNPRASRTVPFVSKATGHSIARYAAQVQAGRTLEELGFISTPDVDGFFVKEAVMPFDKLPGVDVRLSPEMRSTGEVMGHASRFGHAFAKAELAAGVKLPKAGAVLLTVNDFDKSAAIKMARDLHRMDFELFATEGTADALRRVDVPVTTAPKAGRDGRTTVDLISEGAIDLVINTPLGSKAHEDQAAMYTAAVRHGVPLLTTTSAAQAAVAGIKALRGWELKVRALQDHHRRG